MTRRMTTIMVAAFLVGASAARAVEVPDDTLPEMTKFAEEPGRIYLTGRDRILEYKQRNCLWYTEDRGKTWKMKPVDDTYFRDSGYGYNYGVSTKQRERVHASTRKLRRSHDPVTFPLRIPKRYDKAKTLRRRRCRQGDDHRSIASR